jgi:F-type H+-transporting ATPase subunit delta
MITNGVARRYAKALYDVTKSHSSNDLVLAELRALRMVFQMDPAVHEFVASPIVSPEQKSQVIKKAFESKVSSELFNTLLLMADKGRLDIFSELVGAFEEISDKDHGVTRGAVKSGATLSPESRQKIEEIVTKVTGKKVILNFTEDSSILGGMVAQVGGWVFDDTLASHLRRMSEELNRRAN